MLDIPGLQQEAVQGQDWQYLPPANVFDEEWTEADLAELWEFAQTLPRNREQQLYGRMKFPRWKCIATQHPTGKNNRGFVGHEARCPLCKSTEVEPINKRIIGLGSYSSSANNRGLKDGRVNPKSFSLDSAPPIIQKFAAKLTKMNGGKVINYLSFIAYENEQDHIGWHQHREDQCRDAKVYILSMGEVRTFGIRRVCEKHRLPAEKCLKNCATTCLDGPQGLCRSCQKVVGARGTCPNCESVSPTFQGKREGKPWTTLHPAHGSVIVLDDAANKTLEHAILDDKQPKGLRISINTKNIRQEDINAVEGAGTTRFVPASSSVLPGVGRDLGVQPIPTGSLGKLSPEMDKPRVYSIKRKHPKDAVYVGCAGGWECCKCHEQNVRSGSVYGNSYTPRKWGGHKKNPIARTPEEYQQKLDTKWESTASEDVSWKERAIKELRGKNLLCWCSQPEDVDGVKVMKPEGCHARVLFECVNRKEE